MSQQGIGFFDRIPWEKLRRTIRLGKKTTRQKRNRIRNTNKNKNEKKALGEGNGEKRRETPSMHLSERKESRDE